MPTAWNREKEMAVQNGGDPASRSVRTIQDINSELEIEEMIVEIESEGRVVREITTANGKKFYVERITEILERELAFSDDSPSKGG